MRLSFTIPLLVLTAALSVSAARGDAPPPDYARDVAPILTKYCAGCHNEEDREGELALDSYAALQKGGGRGPALLPGDGESSRLIRLLAEGAEPRMPPEDEPAPSDDEVALLRLWIDAGARGPDGAEPERRTLLTPGILPRGEPVRPVGAVAASPDGKLIAVARFRSVELLDSVENLDSVELLNGASRQVLAALEQQPGKVNGLRFSADGKLLVVASGVTGLYGRASLWEVATRREVRVFEGHRDTLYAAALDPRGKMLATASYDRRIVLWDAATGEQLRTLTGHNGAVYDLAFDPAGDVLATASGDETIKLWRVADGARLDTLPQPQAEQYVVRFSPDGKWILAGGADNRLRVWRYVSRKKPRINPLRFSRFAHEGPLLQLAFSGDGGALVTSAEDGTLKQWETRTFTETHLFEPQPDIPAALALLPDRAALIVGRMDGSLAEYALADAEVAKAQPSGGPPPAGATAGEPSAEAASEASTAAAPPAAAKPPGETAEVEPNDTPDAATPLELPAVARGAIGAAGDVDLFAFSSPAGAEWVVEVNAARSKSPLDSAIEVLDADGRPIPRLLLQAVRDSYFTFRGKDSSTSDDFRVHNWREMVLNEYLYAGGEVTKLFHYPRGADSGFKVYPGRGRRHAYFDTTPLSHDLGAPCYIVRPHPTGSQPIPNGLPVFTLYYENDDESRRRLGRDSQLTFTAPREGKYHVRLRDVRGFGGEKFSYRLTVRPRRPDFRVRVEGANPTVAPGSGKKFAVHVERIDGFDGAVRVQLDGLPPGFEATSPLVVEAGQESAWGTLRAAAGAQAPTAENGKTSRLTATATVGGRQVSHDAGTLGEIKLGKPPQLLVTLEPAELTIAPGETVTATLRVERKGHKGLVAFGKEEAGWNLPHGVFVDNIGLNGVLIPADASERQIFVTADRWVPETTRPFFLEAQQAGKPTSPPVTLHVRRAAVRR